MVMGFTTINLCSDYDGTVRLHTMWQQCGDNAVTCGDVAGDDVVTVSKKGIHQSTLVMHI